MFRIAIASVVLTSLAATVPAEPPSAADPVKHPGGAVAEPKKSGDAEVEANSPEVEGVRLNILAPKLTGAGSAVPLHANVLNAGKDDALISWETSEPMMVQVTLSDGRGKPVPFTAFGKKKIDPTDPIDQLNKLKGSIRSLKVPPGGASDVSVLNLALYYDLTLPGDYSLVVSRTVQIGTGPTAHNVELTADKVVFTIGPP